jgi:hypothetical protein
MWSQAIFQHAPRFKGIKKPAQTPATLDNSTKATEVHAYFASVHGDGSVDYTDTNHDRRRPDHKRASLNQLLTVYRAAVRITRGSLLKFNC